MAKVIDESLKKQLSKKMVHFLKYFPVRIKNVGEDAVAARNLIWAFKDSRDDAYEIIVVDNNSNEFTPDDYTSISNNIEIERLSRYIGYGMANNEGVKIAIGK